VERVERLLVDPEATRDVERAEARRHDARRERETERRVPVHARHRPVGERVRRIGQELGHGDERDPPGHYLVERPPDRIRRGDMRDQQRAACSERSGDRRHSDRVTPQPAPHGRRRYWRGRSPWISRLSARAR